MIKEFCMMDIGVKCETVTELVQIFNRSILLKQFILYCTSSHIVMVFPKSIAMW